MFFDFLLHDRFDVYAALGQDARHLRQHARMILGLDAQVIGAFARLDRQDRMRRQRIGLEGQMRHSVFRVRGHGTHHVHQIGHDGRRGRLHTGTGTVEQRRTGGITIDHHGVHDAIDVGDQTVGRDQRRVYAQFDALGGAARNTQMLDAVAQRFGVVHVRSRQLGDAFGIGLVELQRNAKGNGGQDGQLVRRIDPLDVEGRVNFGVTQRLGFSQHIRERTAFLAHFSKDEVTRAVDDARHPVDTVRRQTFTNGLDDRNTTGNSRFKRHDHALLTRLGEDFVAVHRDQRLVGGDHVLAVFDGLEDQFTGKGVAADQFDDDIDFRVGRNGEHIAGGRRTANLAVGVWCTNCNLRHFDSTPGAAGNLLGVTLKYVESTATDSTQPTYAYFDRFH